MKRSLLWEVRTGEQLLVGDLLETFVRSRCIAYSPDGKTLASGSYDGTLLLWDLTQLTFNR